ncbi:hypothetical protein ILUMI_25494 [Ignelater luminosus]|uniref:Uncharacterized protein n=1 Tax=Ignelater luminosus TaxID=2038154 RepID=A0A8K0CBL8_IGNLU|nr:hypothetical protein ILUMI_25494 [Ignelater luminosus]
MDIIAVKVIVALLFGLIRFVFGIFPIKVYKWLKSGKSEQIQSAVNERKQKTLLYIVAVVQSFGGGVLFATTFLHMMPAVYYSVEELREFGIIEADYPYSQLVVSLGFFTVYFAEEVSQWLISKTPDKPFKKHSKGRVSSTTTIVSIEKEIPPEFTKIPNGMAFEVEKKNEKNNNFCEKNEKYIEDNVTNELVIDSIDQSVQTDNDENLKISENLENNLGLKHEENKEVEEFIEEEVKTQQQILRCFLMIMALSLHAIFEGLAIGLQRSITSIWYLFTAVSIHSATILFCIGMEVVCLGTSPRSTMIHMSILSSTSPFGVLLGLVITLTTDLHTRAKSLAIVLLEGLSAGTILYITFFEILSREKGRKGCRVLRAISIGAGFTLMALLQCLKIDT